MAQTVNDILRGRQNNTTTVTLQPGATQTIISDDRFTADTVLALTPKTSSAAAASGLYVVPGTGQATIYHDNHAATDRTYGVVYVG